MSKLNHFLVVIFNRLFPERIIYEIMKILPKKLLIFSNLKLINARKIFQQSLETPAWLGWRELESLQNKYRYTINTTKYNRKSFYRRGRIKATEIINLLKKDEKGIKTSLELGCSDGMVCFALQCLGKMTTGIDINIKHFDTRTLKKGVNLLKMNAEDLKFADESFDLIFSYNSFEHFFDPDKVLKEAIRTVKKNGYIYLSFDPLYMSPWGLHVFKRIFIPYCQFLFRKEMLIEFSKLDRIRSIPWEDLRLNEWSLEDYRNLWKKYSNKLKIIKYKESLNLFYLDLIIQYPSCFRSKTKFFNNLIVKKIEVLFKKI